MSAACCVCSVWEQLQLGLIFRCWEVAAELLVPLSFCCHTLNVGGYLIVQVPRMPSRLKRQWERWAGASHHSSAGLWKPLQTAFHETILHSALPLKSGRSCHDDLEAAPDCII